MAHQDFVSYTKSTEMFHPLHLRVASPSTPPGPVTDRGAALLRDLGIFSCRPFLTLVFPRSLPQTGVRGTRAAPRAGQPGSGACAISSRHCGQYMSCVRTLQWLTIECFGWLLENPQALMPRPILSRVDCWVGGPPAGQRAQGGLGGIQTDCASCTAPGRLTRQRNHGNGLR